MNEAKSVRGVVSSDSDKNRRSKCRREQRDVLVQDQSDIVLHWQVDRQAYNCESEGQLHSNRCKHCSNCKRCSIVTIHRPGHRVKSFQVSFPEYPKWRATRIDCSCTPRLKNSSDISHRPNPSLACRDCHAVAAAAKLGGTMRYVLSQTVFSVLELRKIGEKKRSTRK